MTVKELRILISELADDVQIDIRCADCHRFFGIKDIYHPGSKHPLVVALTTKKVE